MRFEKTQERCQQGRLGGAGAKLVRPNSGQVEKALRPTLFSERCRERREAESDRVILVFAKQSLEQPSEGEEEHWRGF
jgi:hypothetical protein